ncbi:MAG: type II toxin-antitoxin system HicB family antitoxin [Desulfovibrio sp.]|nr:type II toxin-antitoxin system HicB family antitoxin [Desulfovibrio sp.]
MHKYVAQFAPAEDKEGAWYVEFPQLEGCCTEGDTLPEALENARECLTSYLEASSQENEEFPVPLDPEETRRIVMDNMRAQGQACPVGIFFHTVLSYPLEK